MSNRKELTQAQINSMLSILSPVATGLQEDIKGVRAMKGEIWKMCDKEGNPDSYAFTQYSVLRRALKIQRKQLAQVESFIKTLKTQR